MRINISTKNPLFWLYTAGGILLLAAVCLWTYKVCTNPERVFWQTFENSLAVQSVTVQAKNSSNGVDISQVIRYSLGADNLSHSLTTLSQQGTVVRNEMVSTPTSDYTRYISVVTDQKKKDGSKLDFSKLLGVWAQGPDGMGQSFAQAVFGGSLPVGGIAVPMGNLSPADRKELVQQVKRDKVYQMSFNNVEKKRVNGRLQYTYNVTVPPSGYIAMMKRYAQLSGLHGLDQLNPDDYKKSNPFKLTITIDVRSHRVIKVASLDEGSEQTYTNYGVPVQITVPEKFITTQKLQQLLTEAQQ